MTISLYFSRRLLGRSAAIVFAQKRLIRFAIVVLVLSIVIILVVSTADTTARFPLNLAGASWTEAAIEERLGVPLPENARDIRYEGHQGRGGFLDLSLTSSLKSINQFMRQLCGNTFYEGYDPFEAIDIGEPFTFAHRIEIGLYPYYSYSPGIPETVLGNRCQLFDGAVYAVRVDTTDPDSAALHLRLSFSCELCQYLQPAIVKPISDFPLQILGFRQVGEAFTPISNEICFGLDFSIASLRDQWAYILGGRIRISIDDRLSAWVYISDDGILMPRYDAAGNFVEVTNSGNPHYYCLEGNLHPGSHSMLVEVATTSGQDNSYLWTFELQSMETFAPSH